MVVARVDRPPLAVEVIDYNIAIERKPDNARSYVDRGMAHAGAGDKDSAMIDYNHALFLDSTNAYALFQKALLEIDQEHLKEGLADLNRVVQLAPYSASGYFNRAILKSKLKDYYGALNDYNKVLVLNPDNILTFYNRAALKADNGDLAGSLKDYDKVIFLYPEFIEAYRNRAQVKRELNDLKGAAWDEKKASDIQKMQSSASDSAKYYESLKILKLMSLSDDFETVRDTKGKLQYGRADIELQPIFSVILFPSTGNRVRVYDAATKRHYGGDELTLFNKNDSMDAGLAKKKFEQLDSAIRANPSKANNYGNRGIIFSALQTYDHALSDFDKAIDLDPSNALYYFNRANTRIKLFDKQREDADDAVSNPGINPADKIYKQALDDYTMALSLDSNFTYAWYNGQRPG